MSISNVSVPRYRGSYHTENPSSPCSDDVPKTKINECWGKIFKNVIEKMNKQPKEGNNVTDTRVITSSPFDPSKLLEESGIDRTVSDQFCTNVGASFATMGVTVLSLLLDMEIFFNHLDFYNISTFQRVLSLSLGIFAPFIPALVCFKTLKIMNEKDDSSIENKLENYLTASGISLTPERCQQIVDASEKKLTNFIANLPDFPAYDH